MSNKYVEAKISLPENALDAVSDILQENHALAITYIDASDQPLYEIELNTLHLWKNTQIIALFENKLILQNALDNIKKIYPDLHYEISEVPDKNWVEITQANFKEKKFGQRLWVCPPWKKIAQKKSEKVLVLNPGLAFGTGSHPTTELCLEWLDSHINMQKIVVDYGCGSGILALAAIKLGAKTVYAVDHDKQALEATKNNATLNHISKNKLKVCLPDDLPNIQADVLIANILKDPLIELAASFVKLIKNKGNIVLSGILKDQIQDIYQYYSQWFELESFCRDEWAIITGIKMLNH